MARINIFIMQVELFDIENGIHIDVIYTDDNFKSRKEYSYDDTDIPNIKELPIENIVEHIKKHIEEDVQKGTR